MTTYYSRSFFPWMECVLPPWFTPSRLLNDGVLDEPRVSLTNLPLWEKFSELGTEMVITKPGRRTFPTISVRISGLNKESRYHVMLDLVSLDPSRYKYANCEWQPAGCADPPLPPRPFFHPEGPATGQVWMRKGASFDKMKLTNNMNASNGQMILHSMHKYLPRIHIIRCDTLGHPILSTLKTFSFNETAFIAVTAYQNNLITELKIEKNPFARGFRKDKFEQRALKRKLQLEEVETESETEEEKPSKQPTVSEREESIGRVHADLLSHWHMALLSMFGGPFLRKLEHSPKRSGFDMRDILGES